MPSIDNLALECDRTITNLTKDDQPELSAMLLKLMVRDHSAPEEVPRCPAHLPAMPRPRT